MRWANVWNYQWFESSVRCRDYWSGRVGRNNSIFKMPKFRTMQIGTPAVATHLLSNPDAYLTPIGSFLRKSSLDELPLCGAF